jgi:streptogramin lyase
MTMAGRVARLAASGAFTEYMIPMANSTPVGIAIGPDGNIWFTDRGTNQVVRVTPAGEFTHYPIPTRNSDPGAITTGPDGNIWFVEGYPGKLARVTTSGAIAEFAVPGDNWLGGIASGPDGNLWVTELFRRPRGGPGVVAKVNPPGTFTPQSSSARVSSTEFKVPLTDAGGRRWGPPEPGAIAAGRDGNLWFLNTFAIDRVTPSGVFTEYPVPMLDLDHGLLSGFAAGPDGNIWFTENRQGQQAQVGRLIIR